MYCMYLGPGICIMLKRVKSAKSAKLRKDILSVRGELPQ